MLKPGKMERVGNVSVFRSVMKNTKSNLGIMSKTARQEASCEILIAAGIRIDYMYFMDYRKGKRGAFISR